MRRITIVLTTLVCLFAMPTFADTISIGQWYTGSWTGGGPGTIIGACVNGCPYTGDTSGETFADPGASPWTFTALTDVMLIVTDIQINGDSFTIMDGGALLGSTNTVIGDQSNCGLDGADCWASPSFSHGEFLLAAGGHSLTFIVAAQNNGFDDGSVSFFVQGSEGTGNSAVPEPGSLGLLLAGALGVIAARKKLAGV